ncbi:MAG TPA: FHA domain-containing protein [Xanthomonadales bacterium]|nr:FHA domain-containing protein [Xanthomonadales bacterium]
MTSYRLKGASGKVAGSTHNLAAVTRIGTAGECELQLEEAGLAGQQAEIRLEADGSLRLRKLQDGLDILLNGKAVSDTLLNSGDEIRIGTCRWVLQAPGLRPQKVLTRQAVKRRTSWLPWLVPVALLAAAALAFQRGWLAF